MRKVAKLLMLFSFSLSLLSGCAKSEGTSTGNPLVALRFSSFNSTLVASHSLKTAGASALSLGVVKMCFKRLRFKQDSTAVGSEVDLELGEVTLSAAGTDLGEVSVPAGSYSRIEFDLDDDCGSGSSVALQNSNGTYATNDHITIKFDGNFVYPSDGLELELQVGTIMDAFKQVSSSNQIRSQAESVSGSY